MHVCDVHEPSKQLSQYSGFESKANTNFVDSKRKAIVFIPLEDAPELPSCSLGNGCDFALKSEKY